MSLGAFTNGDGGCGGVVVASGESKEGKEMDEEEGEVVVHPVGSAERVVWSVFEWVGCSRDVADDAVGGTAGGQSTPFSGGM